MDINRVYNRHDVLILEFLNVEIVKDHNSLDQGSQSELQTIYNDGKITC